MDDKPEGTISPPDESEEMDVAPLSDTQDVSSISEKSKHLVNNLVRALEIAERHLDTDEVALPYELFTQMLWSQTFRYATYMLDLSESESFDKDMLVRYMKSVVAPDSDDLPPVAQAATEIFKPGSRTKADGDEFDRKVGRRLAKAREISGLRMDEAARKLKISPQALYKYERGERTIKAKLVYDAALLYRVDGNWLLCLTDVLRVTKMDEDGYLITTTYRDTAQRREQDEEE